MKFESLDEVKKAYKDKTLEKMSFQAACEILDGIDEEITETFESARQWIENSEHFETVPYSAYSIVTMWSVDMQELLTWGMLHEHGTKTQKKWIEDFLEDINFHDECERLLAGDYKGYVKWVLKKDSIKGEKDARG